MRKLIYIAIALLLTVSTEAQVDRTQQPQPGPAPTINLGKPQTFELPNGLKVLVVENHKLPRVTFSLTLDNPPTLEGSIKGVDDLTSSMLGNGTSKISKDDFNRQIDFYGAMVSFSTNGLSGRTLSRYFPQLLSLAAQGVLDPSFTQEDLDAERAKLLDGLKADEKSAQSIARQMRSTLLFGKNHPYGEVLTDSTINRVSLADVKNYYKKNFVPENAYLVVIGDITFDEVKKLVTKDFSSWKRASAPISKYTEPTNLGATEIDFVNVPNAVQSEISLNNVVNLKMTDPDYFAALLANYILGGGGEARLFKNLRETHAWTYGSYSRISGDKRTTVFSATASVRNAVTDSAIMELKKEIARLRLTKPTQQELDLAKAAYIGNFVMSAQKTQAVAGFALKERTQALPADFYENYIKNIEAVTLEEVQAAAQKHILNEGTRIIVVGKAADVLPGLEKLDLPIKYFDRYGDPTTKPQLAIQAADVSVESILQKYIDAVGGVTNLEKIKMFEYVAKGDLGGNEIVQRRVETADGQLLQLVQGMGMDIFRLVLTKDKGYAQNHDGQRFEMGKEEVEKLKGTILFPELKMLKHIDAITFGGIEEVEGRKAYKLEEGNSYFYYDIDSGLKLGQGEVKVISPEQEVNEVMYFSDYKEKDGIKVPYRMVVGIGMDLLQLDVTDVKISQEIDQSIFQ